jgi:hypothetical protein
MNSFDLKPVSNLIVQCTIWVLRTKYDYIFKIKILEFYFGILSLKLYIMSKKSIYLLIGGAVVVIALLIILQNRLLEKDEGRKLKQL